MKYYIEKTTNFLTSQILNFNLSLNKNLHIKKEENVNKL